MLEARQAGSEVQIAQHLDCPCHGARFLPDGSVLSGPAVHALSPVMPKRAD